MIDEIDWDAKRDQILDDNATEETKEDEDFDEWLEEQTNKTKTITIQRGNATNEEWAELKQYLYKKMWDFKDQ